MFGYLRLVTRNANRTSIKRKGVAMDRQAPERTALATPRACSSAGMIGIAVVQTAQNANQEMIPSSVATARLEALRGLLPGKGGRAGWRGRCGVEGGIIR